MTGANPVKNTGSYKHNIGDTVNIIFNPKNKEYVDVEGSYTDYLYGAVSLVLGIVNLVVMFLKR